MIDVLSFILKFKFIIIFYLLVIAFIAFNWKRIEKQAKIIFLYRSKFGLRWMDYVSTKFREWIVLFGYIGMGAGFVGLVIISYVLISNLYQLITKPAAVSGVSLVLPGVNVPGLGVLPFWYWLIAIFCIAVIHEFSHGIVARAHKIDVKNTGIVFFGPILGAFVEPDEKKLRKQQDIVQYSVLAAGSFSNIVLAILALLLLNFAFMPLQKMMAEPVGVSFDAYTNNTFPAAEAGIKPGTIITGINDQKTENFRQFSEELSSYHPGESITINTAEKDYPLKLAANPDNPKKSFLGVFNVKNKFNIKENYQHGIGKILYHFLEWFTGMGSGLPGFLGWLWLLSMGIGLFNLLPLPIVDGGRMAQVFLHKLKGPEKGERWYHKVSLFFLLVLLLNLFYPLLVKLL
ncbi:MAG: site-2 protease family protein [Nanoarchaeota archaeon]|nr:site-2 protease family protein [Nanoarchaeota archaeon]